MTYASEMFAWYAGSLEADTYFCPERHGMYFGGFGMKTAPAMGKQNYSISTSLTGDSGEAFLAVLTDAQRKRITDLVDLQRKDLAEIVTTRRAIATELRRFQKGEWPTRTRCSPCRDNTASWTARCLIFTPRPLRRSAKTLTRRAERQTGGDAASNPADAKGPFLYSTPISNPKIENTDFLFGVR